MTTILFIHGANSTRRTFNYLRQGLVQHEAEFFEYNTHVPCSANIKFAQAMVDQTNPDVIIGHSLGGIIATYLTTEAKKITIATPFGGSALANWFPMYSQLMRDVATTSPLIRGLRDKTVDGARFLSVVANGLDGNGFDGVISTRSQMALTGPQYLVVDLNHFEVMVDDQIITTINEFI